MEKLRGGIIGTGMMGRTHAKLATESGKVEIVAVFDAVFDRAETLAAQYHAKPFGDLDEMLDYGVDIVYIAVPNNFHAPLTIHCLDRGVNVFCEKPLCTSLADAAKLKEAVERSGKRLFVGHNRRFAPVYLAAKQTIQQPDFKPTSVNIIQNDGDMGGSVWAADFVNIGGFLYDTTVHFLDMAEYLVDEICEVRALGMSACYEGIDDDFVIQFRYKGGGHGAITSCGHASWISPFERVQVVGDHRSVITEELDSFRYCPGLSKTITAEGYEKLPFEVKWGYQPMHEHMYECLEKGVPALNDGISAGIRSVALVEACYRSAARYGEAIQVSEEEENHASIC